MSTVTCPQLDTFFCILSSTLTLLSNSSTLSLQGLRIVCHIFAVACNVSPVTYQLSPVSPSHYSLFTLWFCFPIAQSVCLVARIKNNVPHFCRNMSFIPCHMSAVTCPQLDTFIYPYSHSNYAYKHIIFFVLLQGLGLMCRIFATTYHVSPVTCHMSTVTCPQLETFFFILSPTLILHSNRSKFLVSLQWLRIMCLIFAAACHVLPVTYQLSPVLN